MSDRFPRRKAAALLAALVCGVLMWRRLGRLKTSPVELAPPPPEAAARTAGGVPAPETAPSAELPPDQRPYVRSLRIQEPPPPGADRKSFSAAAPASARAPLSPRPPAPARGFSDWGTGSSSARAYASCAPARAPSAAPAPPARTNAPDPADAPLGGAGGVAAQARGLKNSSAGNAAIDPKVFAAQLINGISENREVNDMVRTVLAGLGPGASDDARRRAVAGALSAAGRDSDPDDVTAALALADAPPRPPPTPQAIAEAAEDIAAHQPSPEEAAEIARHLNDPMPQGGTPGGTAGGSPPGAPQDQAAAPGGAQPQPAPQIDNVPPVSNGPPPKGSLEVYQKYKDVFDRAQKDYGVKPQDILAILKVETDNGQNMGSKSLSQVLQVRAENGNRQSEKDLVALGELSSNGDLGGLKPSQVPSNYVGAYGPPQFLASSQVAYGVSADGKGTNLFQLPNSILSIANYLNKNGYKKSVAGSIFAYNHSSDYVHQVMQRSANIAPAVQKDAAAKPSN